MTKGENLVLAEKLAAAVTERLKAFFAAKFEMLKPPTVKAEGGRKFAKLVTYEATGGRSVYGFVNLENGEVLKAASWAAPAKGARGSLYSPEGGMEACGPYGVNYRNGHLSAWS